MEMILVWIILDRGYFSTANIRYFDKKRIRLPDDDKDKKYACQGTHR